MHGGGRAGARRLPFLRQAGRAGRRGKDDIGHVVLCRSKFEGAAEAHGMRLEGNSSAADVYAETFAETSEFAMLRDSLGMSDEALAAMEAELGAAIAERRDVVSKGFKNENLKPEAYAACLADARAGRAA